MNARLIVNIDVPDIDAGIAFYESALDFVPRRRLFGGAVAELEGHGIVLHLLHKAPGSQPVPGVAGGRVYADHWTPVHVDFTVADVAQAVERALAAGARAIGPVLERAFGRMAAMRDPFGHGFCLIEFSTSGYDAVVADMKRS